MKKIDFIYKPIPGRIENIGQYQSLCELVRYEIEKDQELLNLHENRLDENFYRDRDHNILTQDFIYAVAQHLDNLPFKGTGEKEIVFTEEIQSSELRPNSEGLNFTPKIINHIENNIENKHIGDFGEIWVLKKEKEFLKYNCKPKLAKKIKHVAKDRGDGLEYDILSFDLEGN